MEITLKVQFPEFKRPKEFVKRVFLRVRNDVWSKPKRGVAALVIAAVFFWMYGIGAALLWLLFLLFLVYEWENRIIGVFSLISLVSCPILLALNQHDVAETMAVYAYFFLVMTVALQIVEYKRHPERFDNSAT